MSAPHPTPDSVSPTVSPPGSGGPSFEYVAIRNPTSLTGGSLIAVVRTTLPLGPLDAANRRRMQEFAQTLGGSAYGGSEELWRFVGTFPHWRRFETNDALVFDPA